jgi:hypothetical protein
VAKVLTVMVHKDASVVADILSVPATKVGIEKSVWHTPQSLNRRFESLTANVELDASFLRFLVLVHGCNLAAKLSQIRLDLSDPLGEYFRELG